MSLVDEEIERSVGGSGGGDSVGDDGDGDADEEEEGGGGSHNGRCRCRGEKSKKQRFYRSFGKAKQVVLQPFTRRQKANSCVFSSGKRFGGGVNGGGGNKGCYFCFTQPTTLGSPMRSQSSDPENPNFTFEMLRVFVEKNDFYSKECNHHHLDVGVFSNTTRD